MLGKSNQFYFVGFLAINSIIKALSYIHLYNVTSYSTVKLILIYKLPTNIYEIKMEQSVKHVNVQEANVLINGGEGVELSDVVTSDAKGKDQSGNLSGDQIGKLNDNNGHDLKGSDNESKNGDSALGKIRSISE